MIVVRTYCSKTRKKVLFKSHQRPGTGLRVGAAGKHDGPGLWMWLPLTGKGNHDECNNIVHSVEKGTKIMPASRHPYVTFRPSSPSTPASFIPSAPRPTLSQVYDKRLSLLPADAHSGGPYEDFLRAWGQKTMLHHLELWQEQDTFLNLLLKMENGPSMALWQVLEGPRR